MENRAFFVYIENSECMARPRRRVYVFQDCFGRSGTTL